MTETTETFYIKSRTPIELARVIEIEQLGNEIHIKMYINNIPGDTRTENKVFTYSSDKEAEIDYKDFKRALDDS